MLPVFWLNKGSPINTRVTNNNN